MRNLVSIIIVNLNGMRFLRPCLDSIRLQTYSDYELIFVDCGSTDGSRQCVERDHPQARLIRQDRYQGFCKMNNIGIRQAKGEYVLLLNIDIVLSENFLEEMVRAMERDEHIGSVSGKLYFQRADGKKIIDTTGHFLTRERWHQNIGEGQEDSGQFEHFRYIFGVCGAAPLYRRQMLEDIKSDGQYFDELFYQTREDVDLDWRAQLRGWKALYTPKAIAYHYRTGSNWNKNRKIMYHHYKNRYLLLWKNDTAGSIWRSLFYIAKYDARALFFTMLKKSRPYLFPLFVQGVLSSLIYIPPALRKRAMIQKRRLVSQDYIERWFATTGFEVQE